MELARFFEAGGWMMYLLLLLGMLAAPAAIGLPIISFAVGKPRLAMSLAMVCAAIGLLAVGLGVLGRSLGLHTMEEAIAHVNPADADVIRAAGSSEARVCVIFSLMVAALPLAGACVCLGRALSAKVTGLGIGGGLVLAAGVATLAVMLALHQSAVRTGEEAIAHVNPEDRATIGEYARADALSSLRNGALVGLPLCALGIVLLALGSRSKKD